MRIYSNATDTFLVCSPDLSCSQEDFKYLLIKLAEKRHEVSRGRLQLDIIWVYIIEHFKLHNYIVSIKLKLCDFGPILSTGRDTLHPPK